MASNDLSRVLDNMKLENGQPNTQLRASAIQHLLHSSTLTFGELRMFKAFFDGIDLRYDIVGRLPIELVTLVMEYLDLEDFMYMRSVSRQWREKLSNEKLCKSLIKLHLSTTWKVAFNSLEDKDGKLKLVHFFEKCTRLLKRHRGMYDSVVRYYYPESLHGGFKQDKKTFQYRSGRIAMRTDPSTIQVNNLRTHSSIQYMHGQRYPFDHWLLSNQTLVAYFDHPKPHLKVWPLDEEVDPDVIHLECRHSILAAYNRQVAFYIENNSSMKDIHIWNDGHITKLAGLKLEDVSTSYRPCEGGLVFHPIQENHQFVFYQPFDAVYGKANPGEIIVQEYIAGAPHKTWRKNLTSTWTTRGLRLEHINNEGVVTILPTLRGVNTDSVLNVSRGAPALQLWDYPVTFNPITQELHSDSNNLNWSYEDKWSDDDFIVANDVQGYVVWCFDRKITLPEGVKPFEPF